MQRHTRLFSRYIGSTPHLLSPRIRNALSHPKTDFDDHDFQVWFGTTRPTWFASYSWVIIKRREVQRYSKVYYLRSSTSNKPLRCEAVPLARHYSPRVYLTLPRRTTSKWNVKYSVYCACISNGKHASVCYRTVYARNLALYRSRKGNFPRGKHCTSRCPVHGPTRSRPADLG